MATRKLRYPNTCFPFSFFCLLGGYDTFYSLYPEFCIDVKPVSQERTETERSINSHYEKPCFHHKPAYDQVCLAEDMTNPAHAWAPWGALSVIILCITDWFALYSCLAKKKKNQNVCCYSSHFIYLCLHIEGKGENLKYWMNKHH